MGFVILNFRDTLLWRSISDLRKIGALYQNYHDNRVHISCFTASHYLEQAVNGHDFCLAGPLQNCVARRLLICIFGALKAIMAVLFIFVHKHNFVSAEKKSLTKALLQSM